MHVLYLGKRVSCTRFSVHKMQLLFYLFIEVCPLWNASWVGHWDSTLSILLNSTMWKDSFVNYVIMICILSCCLLLQCVSR